MWTHERAHQEGILSKNSEKSELKAKFKLLAFQWDDEFPIDTINLIVENQRLWA